MRQVVAVILRRESNSLGPFTSSERMSLAPTLAEIFVPASPADEAPVLKFQASLRAIFFDLLSGACFPCGMCPPMPAMPVLTLTVPS